MNALASMGPRFPLLVAALGGCLLPALGCLVCDKRVLDALKSLETDYLPDHLGAEHHKNVMEKLKAGMKDFENLQLEDESFYGVIGEGQAEPGLLGPGKGGVWDQGCWVQG